MGKFLGKRAKLEHWKESGVLLKDEVVAPTKIGVRAWAKGTGTTVVLNEGEILERCMQGFRLKYHIESGRINVSKGGRVSVTLRMKAR